MRKLTDEENELLRLRADAVFDVKLAAALWVGVWIFGAVTPYFEGRFAIGVVMTFTSMFFMARYLYKIVGFDFNRAERIVREIKEAKKQEK
jgi:hypothetical protein